MKNLIPLYPHYFGEREKHFLSHGDFTLSTFSYSSGVAGLRIRNKVGEVEALPFKGQQIWRAEFYGRNLTMGSMFPEPRATSKYMETYGAFLIHCGITGMGAPSAHDKHELHGELPNAHYQTAHLIVGEDSEGLFISLSGTYQHTVAFSHNYIAQPTFTIREGNGKISVNMKVTNFKGSPMDVMYLGHVNFLPVSQGKIFDTIPDSPESIRVIHVFEEIYIESSNYREMIDGFKKDPASHRYFDPTGVIDPEVVFALTPHVDASGWATTLQLHPNGAGDYVRHQPDQFKNSLRWICRSKDQQALGLLLPSTAEPSGYHAEKAKGNLLSLPVGGSMNFDYECGALNEEESAQALIEIEKVRKM